MKRRNRFVAACVAIMALLFAQFAVAAYVCAKLSPPPAVEAPAQGEPACDHSSADNPNLCAQHCLYGDASLGSSQSLPAPADEVLFVAYVPATLASPTPSHLGVRIARLPHPPPLATRFTVLRI